MVRLYSGAWESSDLTGTGCSLKQVSGGVRKQAALAFLSFSSPRVIRTKNTPPRLLVCECGGSTQRQALFPAAEAAKQTLELPLQLFPEPGLLPLSYNLLTLQRANPKN